MSIQTRSTKFIVIIAGVIIFLALLVATGWALSCCGDFGQRIRLISTLPLPAAGNCSGLRWDAGSRALNAGGGCCKTPRYRQ